MATSVWTWGGKFFGSIENDNLWTYDGRHVGRLVDGAIFDRNGHYLGEVRQSRLITALDKQTKLGSSFTPDASRPRVIPRAEYVGYTLDTAYQDFPAPDEL